MKKNKIPIIYIEDQTDITKRIQGSIGKEIPIHN